MARPHVDLHRREDQHRHLELGVARRAQCDECLLVHAVDGFTNRSLRTRVAALLGVPYTSGQMTYDLRRLRRKGLIRRLDHANTYVPTPDGLRVALFYTKLHDPI